MRAVALSDSEVQQRIADHFVPLKITLLPGAPELPLDWPALDHWAKSYAAMGGENSEGFTCCSVVSPDLETEYGSTGSAFVWELFDSIAYDPDKFGAMLDRSLERAQAERDLLTATGPSDSQKRWRLRALRWKTAREVRREGRFRLPPKGFSVEGAKQLFRLTGDLADESADEEAAEQKVEE